MSTQFEMGGDLAAHVEDCLRNGDFKMVDVVKPADHGNYEDDHEIVRLSSSYSYTLKECFATFTPKGKVYLNRITSSDAPTRWELSVEEMQNLIKAYQQYIRTYGA